MILEIMTEIVAHRWAKFIEDCPPDFPNNPSLSECWTWVGGLDKATKRPNPRAVLAYRQVNPRRLLYALHHKSTATPGRLNVSCGNHLCVNPLHVTGNLVAIPSPLTPVPPQPQPDFPPPTPEEETQALEEMRNAIFSRFREFQIKDDTPETAALLLRCGFTQYVIDTYLADYLTQENLP